MPTAKKKKLVIVGQTPPPWHGQAVATKMLFEADWPGFEVHRVRMAFSEEMEDVGRLKLGKLGHVVTLIREVWKLRDPDGVIMYPPTSPSMIPLLRDLLLLPLIRRLFGYRVYIFHAGGVGEWLQSGSLKRFFGRCAYRNCDLCLEVAREDSPAHEAIRAKSYAWTPYGVEVPDWSPSSRVEGAPIEVLFMGSLQEGKGVLQVLETAKNLKDRGAGKIFRFKLVGRWFSSRFRNDAIKLQEELGVEDMVEFPGELTGARKWQAYKDADIFFFPTHYESEAFPLVLIEALGMGLPVVTTRWRGIPDMLNGCPVASILPVRDSSAFGDALDGLRKSLSEDFSLKAREFYESRYRPEDFLSQVYSNISDCVGGSHLEQVSWRQSVPSPRPIEVWAYIADQNPKLGRSLGISRMSTAVLKGVAERKDVNLCAVWSRSSVEPPVVSQKGLRLPWSTRSPVARVLTDQFMPALASSRDCDVWYFPKGYMPRFMPSSKPSVATIHDTIIQYYNDHYPDWRLELEYKYWEGMLRNTLSHAAAIMTVSNHAKNQILEFMKRYGLPERKIYVTYEPCLYESISQPVNPPKADYVLHLGSREPHKRTAWLVRLWVEATNSGAKLPKLHIVGKLPQEVDEIARESKFIVYLPFLEDRALVSQFTAAKALIFPSEVEGFGLPAVEAYYLGTPVCFTRGTSVEEILAPATGRGGMCLEEPDSLWRALEDVLAMSAVEVEASGRKLREVYSTERIVDRMMEVFNLVGRRS